MEKAVVSYRQQYQQPQSRREFDLNDPDRLKNQKARDAQMMIPGLVGEDPHHEDRQQRQREQLREWLIQQQREQAAEKQQQELERLHYDRSRVDTDNRALQLQKMEMEKRRAAAVAATKCNRAMAEEKKQMDKEEKPFPSKVGVPGLCHISNRKAPPESLQQVTQFQKHQIEEKKRMELERRKQQEHFHHMTSASARTVLLKERQEERLRKQLRRQLDSANIQLAESRKQRQPDLERGRIDDSFFSKFNTCSR
ncbi:RIB43A-like with coiled-coils protein 2 [Aulostomus maculatus]